MRLLIVRSSKNFSGAERYNVELLRELNKNLNISFLTNLGSLAKELRKNVMAVLLEKWLPEEVGTKKQLLKTLLFLPIFLPKYINVLIDFEVVCLQSRTEMIFLTPILKLFGKKVVWIQHGPIFVSQASKIILWMYKFASKFADKIIAVSEDTKTDLVSGGVSERKVEVLYIGVRTPTIKKYDHPFTIGFLGTITKEKGIEEFINVVTKAKVNAMVIGDGPDRRLIPKEIKQAGFVRDVYAYLRKIDVLFLPTRHHEGISMAILEAMASGVPVVTTDIGGNREIIKNGYNGLLLKPGESFNMNQDWKTMGKHARKTVVEQFNIQTQAKIFAELFKSL